MWAPIKAVGNFFHSLIDKVGAAISRGWDLILPYAAEYFSDAVNAFMTSSKGLLIEAVKYVDAQGLPTGEAKQKAFYDYMASRAKDSWTSLKDREIEQLRTVALSIFQKSTTIK